MQEIERSTAPEHGNASLKTCRQMAGSYGASTTVMEFLERGQITAMQALSKWFYATAVSRVQTRIKKADRVFVKSGDDCLEIVTPSLKVVRKHRQILEFVQDYVQVGQKLFKVFSRRKCGWVSFESGEPLIEIAAELSGSAFKVCNVRDQMIVALQDSRLKCQRYSIARDTWEEQPKPKGLRSDFSMCAVEDWVYVIGGFDHREKMSEHMLRRQFKLDEPGASEWQTVPIPVTQLKPRYQPTLIPMEGNRVYILGGIDIDSENVTQVSVYDHKTKECQAITQSGPECLPNETLPIAVHDKLLICRDRKLITYDLNTNSQTERDLSH